MNALTRSIFILSFSWSAFSWATISLTNLKFYNASRVVIPDSTQSSGSSTGGAVTPTGNPIVYGGIAGDPTAGTCGSITDTTCNNCIGDNKPCNANRISPTSYLRIEFQTDNASVITNTSSIFLLMDTTKITPEPGRVSTTLATGSTLFVEVSWAQICSLMGSSNCSTSVSGAKTFQVGLSSTADNTLDEAVSFEVYVAGIPSTAGDYANYQYFTPCPTEQSATEADGGYCHLTIERGDGKAYVINEVSGANFNHAPGGINYKYLRVYYGQGGAATCQDVNFATAVTSASDYKDMSFTEQNGSFTLDDNRITGLENGTTYYFRFANVDEAGNVLYFSGDQVDPAATGANKGYLNCTEHSAVPAEVVGLLDGKECFIATAAYGSSMAPQLNILRRFRDQFLKTNRLGHWLVTKYYEYSPQLAQKIRKRESARAATRVALSPVISMAQWVIFYGLKSFLMVAAIGFVLGFLAMRRVFKEHE